MKLHLYWIEPKWKEKGGMAAHANLVIDMDNRTYRVYTSAFRGYARKDDIEVRRKYAIYQYAEMLKEAGFQEDKSLKMHSR